MKPSRVLYVIVGASVVCASAGSYPGSGGLSLFILLVSIIAALVFDWNDA